jgi:hypothetical protein
MPRKYVRKAKDPETGEPNPEVKTEVASIKGAAGEDVQKLLDEIEGLKEKLAVSERSRSDAEQAALAKAEAQGGALMAQSNIAEVPTGKSIDIQVLDRYETVGYKDDGRPILKPKFRREKSPTFFYKIDLPPVGGLGLTINGLPLYHGTVYEFDIHSLRTVKEMVYRVWKHDLDIHGSDENAYRKPENKQISMKTGAISVYRG